MHRVDAGAMSHRHFDTLKKKRRPSARKMTAAHHHDELSPLPDESASSNSSVTPGALVYSDVLLFKTSQTGSGDRPRSHANARERDRTHRCVNDFLNKDNRRKE